jgi:hypothetical protein
MGPDHYNKVRRILFSTAQNPSRGFAMAYEWLEKTYRKSLGTAGHLGLLAELKFFERYRREFKLTVAGDMGEHADFAGEYQGNMSRFDVTTNLSTKRFATYEPFLSDGPEYKIVVVDRQSLEVSDVVSLAFRRCRCGGHCMPVFVLLDGNINGEGEASWTNDQLQLEICVACEEITDVARHTHHFMPSPSEHFEWQAPDDPSVTATRGDDGYGLDVYKWLRREHCDELMAVAGPEYTVTGRNGEGYWACKSFFRNSVVEGIFPDVFSADGIRLGP